MLWFCKPYRPCVFGSIVRLGFSRFTSMWFILGHQPQSLPCPGLLGIRPSVPYVLCAAVTVWRIFSIYHIWDSSTAGSRVVLQQRTRSLSLFWGTRPMHCTICLRSEIIAMAHFCVSSIWFCVTFPFGSASIDGQSVPVVTVLIRLDSSPIFGWSHVIEEAEFAGAPIGDFHIGFAYSFSISLLFRTLDRSSEIYLLIWLFLFLCSIRFELSVTISLPWICRRFPWFSLS